jgi:hypothetical protein
MNSRAPVALAIGAGYLLGRTHRLRWALILGAAAATGRLNGIPGQALEQGMKTLRSTPELAKITESAERLLEAGRAAAVSAMSSRVEAMGDKLEGRAQGVGGAITDRARPKRSRNEEDEQADYDEQAEYDEADEEPADDEYDEQDEDEQDEDEQDEDEQDEDETATRRRSQREPVTTGGRRQSSGPEGRRQVVRKSGR